MKERLEDDYGQGYESSAEEVVAVELPDEDVSSSEVETNPHTKDVSVYPSETSETERKAKASKKKKKKATA